MAPHPELLSFIQNGLTQGVSRSQITQVLIENGWKTSDVDEAFLALLHPSAPISASTSVHDQSPNASNLVSTKVPHTRNNLLMSLGLIAVLLVLGGGTFALWFFSKSSQNNVPISQCADTLDVSVAEFAHAEKVPTKRDFSTPVSIFTFGEQVTAQGISFKVPFNSKPDVKVGSVSTRITLGDKSLTVISGVGVEDFKSALSSTECPQLQQEFTEWYSGKTDLQFAQGLINVTSKSRGTLTQDLFFLLIPAKETYQASKDAYESSTGEWFFYQFGNPSEESGRVDVYDKQGTGVAQIVFRNLTQEELDYLLASLK